MNTTHIVPLAEQQFEAVREVIDCVAREKRYLAFTEAPPQEQMYSFLRSLIADGGCSYIALQGGRLVGWCDIQRASGQARQHVGLLGLGLLPEVRGRGFGRELMQAALAQAWSDGLTRVELTVREDNHRARILYERLGFAHEGIKRKVFLVDGKHYDCHAMALLHESVV